MRLGTVSVPDRIACITRRAAIFADTDAQAAMGIAMSESNFDPNAVGDAGCSIGLFQLNTCGGQGSDYADNRDALKDPHLNATIAIRPIALAVLRYRDAGLNKWDYFREVARHSGHPGLVSADDPRIVAIANNCFKLIFDASGRLSPWPAYNPALCADTTAPPPPLGSWSEGAAPTNGTEADDAIRKHLERIGQLVDTF